MLGIHITGVIKKAIFIKLPIICSISLNLKHKIPSIILNDKVKTQITNTENKKKIRLEGMRCITMKYDNRKNMGIWCRKTSKFDTTILKLKYE